MATPVDKLIIEIQAETAKLRKDLKKVNSHLGKTQKRSMMAGKALKAAFAVVSIQAIARVGKGILDTTRQFEDLRATLQANTGSMQETEDAFDMILKFTATTTFQIDQVTKAFIEFRRIGIKPTEADLRGIGNVAAAQGVSIDQIAQAIFRGGTTSIESLQALGFTAKTTGDKMQISFKGTTKEIDKSVESVMKFVREVGETEFASGIEQRANTLTGALSNLGDATAVFQNTIGEAGFKTEMISLVRTLTDAANNSDSLAQSLGVTLGDSVAFVHGSIILFNDALETLSGWLGHENDDDTLIGKINKLSRFLPTPVNALRALFNAVAEVGKDPEGFGFEDDFKGGGSVPHFRDLDHLVDMITKRKEKLNDVSEKLSVTLGTELKQAVINTSTAFTKDFVDALMNGESALESFKNFARNIVSQIISIFLQMAVVNQILNSIFNLTGTDALPVIGGSSGTKSTPKSQNRIGASGKKLQANTPYMVGERGMEMFVPDTGGTLMNNMNTKNAMGGGAVVVNQSINFATGVVPTVRAEVTKMLPQISDVTKGAVLEAAVRGGSFRKGLMGRG